MNTARSQSAAAQPQKTPYALRGRRLLLTLLLAVVALHVIGTVVLGSVVVFRHIFKREVAFEAPPEVVKRIDPRKLEHKVKVQKQQQKSGRPKLQPRLSANKVSDFTLPEIKSVAAPKLDPLKSTLQSFGAAGIGTGMAGGQGLGGLGSGVSQVRFMGFNTRTERVAVLLDLSPSMLEDERGSFNGFDALKDEIKQLVSTLNNGSVFNLVAFATGVDIYKTEAVRASDENKADAASWIDPYMTDRVNVRNNGTRTNNYTPATDSPKMDATGGLTRFDLAFLAAFESGADSIFVITDGVHHINRKPSDREVADFERRRNAISEIELLRRQEEADNRRKEWDEMNAQRAKRGLPPKIIEAHGFGGMGLAPRFTDEELIEYLHSAAETIYGAKGLPMPKVFIIGYVTKPEDEIFLKDLSQKFKGRFRRARTLVSPINN